MPARQSTPTMVFTTPTRPGRRSRVAQPLSPEMQVSPHVLLSPEAQAEPDDPHVPETTLPPHVQSQLEDWLTGVYGDATSYVPVGNALMVQGMDDFPNSLVTPADINNGRNQRADGTNDDGSWDVVSQGPLGSDWDLVSQGEPRVASDVVSHGEFRVDCDGLGSDYELIFDAGEPVRPRLTELFLLRLSLMTLGMPRRLHIPHLFLQPLPRFAVIFMHTGVIVIRVGAVVIRSGLRTVWHHAPRIMALASAMGNTTIRVGQHTVEVGMLGYEMLGFFLQQLKDFQP